MATLCFIKSCCKSTIAAKVVASRSSTGFLFSTQRFLVSGKGLPSHSQEKKWENNNSVSSSLTTTSKPLMSVGQQLKFHRGSATHGQTNVKNSPVTTAVPIAPETTDAENKKRPDFLYLDTKFNNSQEAYKSKTTFELIRALLVFKLTSFNFLVEHNMKVMKISKKVLGKSLFRKLMRSSFYGHFVAGADVDEIKPVIRKNLKYGVKSILDYSVEEDIPEEKAVEKEQSSCETVDIKPVESTLTNSSARYMYHAEFGDRRKMVTSARTYFYDSEGQCDKNMWTFMKCVDVVAEATDHTGLAAIKLTALGRPQFLLQMSQVLTLMRETFDALTSEETNVVLKRIREETLAAKLTHLGVPVSRDESKQWFTWLDISKTGEIDLYDWHSLHQGSIPLHNLFTLPNLKTGKLESLFPQPTAQEQEELLGMLRRVNTIVEHAAERNVRIMVDAEQTYFQPAISRITMEMMRRFNKDKAVVFNTYQCYLKNAYESFLIDLDLARREDFCFGAKIVRGAYMEQERERAQTIGYEDPINPNFEATTAMYEKVIEKAMKEAKERAIGKVAVMAATHNESTVKFCVEKLKDYNIHREDKVICFGQLLGMCDYISFPLGQSGYSVYKYVPYGPVDEVLPYLSRRAAENKGILEKVKKERRLLWDEIKRRVLPGSSA